MARITHPRPAIGSQVGFGITFHNGVAEHDLTNAPVLTQALEQHGNLIDTPTLDYLADWTVVQLRAYAREQGIPLGRASTKAAILEQISKQSLDAIVEARMEQNSDFIVLGAADETELTTISGELTLNGDVAVVGNLALTED